MSRKLQSQYAPQEIKASFKLIRSKKHPTVTTVLPHSTSHEALPKPHSTTDSLSHATPKSSSNTTHRSLLKKSSTNILIKRPPPMENKENMISLREIQQTLTEVGMTEEEALELLASAIPSKRINEEMDFVSFVDSAFNK